MTVTFHPRATFLRRLMPALLALGLLAGCNLPGPAQNALSTTQTQIAAQATLSAQTMQESAQMTQSALQAEAAAIAEQATQSALVGTQVAQLTQVAVHVQQTLVARATQGTPQPAATAAPEATPTFAPTASAPPPTASPQDTLDERIRSANILVYENIVSDVLPRYVKQALDAGGYTYVDAGDASGFFKSQLLSGARWDLIIAAMESRNTPQGEFYRYLNSQIDQGAAVIIETWNLDDIGGGSASKILERCGVAVQSDWYRPSVSARPIWWLEPQDPLFHRPNEGISLISPDVHWKEDAGDLLMLTGAGGGRLVGGVVATDANQYGTIASCMNGQLLLQTFSSHDYRPDDVVALWQNYIYNTLRAHFQNRP